MRFFFKQLRIFSSLSVPVLLQINTVAKLLVVIFKLLVCILYFVDNKWMKQGKYVAA